MQSRPATVGMAIAAARAKRPASNAEIVAPPTAVKISWGYSGPAGTQFEIWASTNLVAWGMIAQTENNSVPVAIQDTGFFKVRAVDPDTGSVSDWATTAP